MTHGDSIAKRGLAIVEVSGGNSALEGYYCQMIKLANMGAQGVQTQEHVVLRAAVVDWLVAGGEREEKENQVKMLGDTPKVLSSFKRRAH